MAEEKQTSSTIKDAEIKGIYDVWKEKPPGLSLNDNDLIVVTLGNGEKKTFFTCVRPDGTFKLDTADSRSKKRRRELADFLVKNKFATEENVESYNLKEGVKKWNSRKVVI